MKIVVHPLYISLYIVALGLMSLSIHHNPGYGFFGLWWSFLMLSCSTMLLTKNHALGESKRKLNQKDKPIRVFYRGIYLILIAVLFHIPLDSFNNNLAYVTSVLILALNQGFVFGIFFDPFYNEFRGLDRDYYGTTSRYDKKVRKNKELFFWFEIIGFVLTLVASMYIINKLVQ